LRDAAKLAAVLFQFPNWVLPGARAREHIDECITRLAGYQLATEFRRDLWFDAEHRGDTLAFERDRGLVHVIVDAPPGKATAVPAVWETTNDALAVFRLHGRNVATWDDKEAQVASDRFNYDYSDGELETLAPEIVEVARRTALVQIVFNNNYEDQGQRNAKSLERIIRDGVYKKPRRE
jgi:uncharacterized protein YecE (DUF72 family)